MRKVIFNGFAGDAQDNLMAFRGFAAAVSVVPSVSYGVPVSSELKLPAVRKVLCACFAGSAQDNPSLSWLCSCGKGHSCCARRGRKVICAGFAGIAQGDF